jgi:N-acetylmuramidase/Peptidase M15
LQAENNSTHLREEPELHRGRVSLRMPMRLNAQLGQALALQRSWQEIGNLLKRLALRTGIQPDAALAVWNVECGDLPFRRGKPVLRLECHKLWDYWGRSNVALFNQHFQFGGNNGLEGLPWMNHQFRQPEGDWKALHTAQATEYEAFGLAQRLAGLEVACLCSSFGGPQVMGFNHGKLGYPDARSLFHSFGKSQRAQVLGFFDFCQTENLIPALRGLDWHAFARIYNGPSRVNSYAEKINDAWRLARCITAMDGNALAAEEALLAFDYQAFGAFFARLGLRNFSAREFLFRGRENSAPASPAYGLNRFPSHDLWPNIVPVAKAVDAFRAEVGAPVTLQSIYRAPAYNAAIGGAQQSQHMRFAAVDLQVRNSSSPADWLQLMRRIREKGHFTGAIGLHGDALHIDARGENLDL